MHEHWKHTSMLRLKQSLNIRFTWILACLVKSQCKSRDFSSLLLPQGAHPPEFHLQATMHMLVVLSGLSSMHGCCRAAWLMAFSYGITCNAVLGRMRQDTNQSLVPIICSEDDSYHSWSWLLLIRLKESSYQSWSNPWQLGNQLLLVQRFKVPNTLGNNPWETAVMTLPLSMHPLHACVLRSVCRPIVIAYMCI